MRFVLICLAESADGIVWWRPDLGFDKDTPNRLLLNQKVDSWNVVFDPDWIDPQYPDKPQLYNFDAVAYESIMLGFREIHHGPDNGTCAKEGMPKITDLHFAYSRPSKIARRACRRLHVRSERDFGARSSRPRGSSFCSNPKPKG